MKKVAVGQINHPRHVPNDSTNGAFYAGLFAAWETTLSQTIYDAMMSMIGTRPTDHPIFSW